MTKQYKRGDKAIFYALFLDENNENNVIVNNPKINIYHYKNGNKIDDIINADLIQIDSTNEYYYEYNIITGADYGTYNIIYSAEVNGKHIEAQEEFQVQSRISLNGGII